MVTNMIIREPPVWHIDRAVEGKMVLRLTLAFLNRKHKHSPDFSFIAFISSFISFYNMPVIFFAIGDHFFVVSKMNF